MEAKIPRLEGAVASDLEHSSSRIAVSVAEAVEMLGISKSLAYEAIASGELPSIRRGRRILVPISAIEALLVVVRHTRSTQ